MHVFLLFTFNEFIEGDKNSSPDKNRSSAFINKYKSSHTIQSTQTNNIKRQQHNNKHTITMVEQKKATENPITDNTNELLSINEGMKEQLDRQRDERVENAKLDSDLKVLVDSDKDVKDLEKLIGKDNVVHQEDLDNVNLRDEKQVDVDALYQDAQKNLNKAKESMKNLKDSMKGDEGDQQQQSKTSEEDASKWHFGDTVKEVAEEAKGYVGNAVDYMKHLVQRDNSSSQQKEEEQPKKQDEKVQQEESSSAPTFTEKIVNTLETGAEKVLHVFGLDKDNSGSSDNKDEQSK
jgi:hypothetical protein